MLSSDAQGNLDQLMKEGNGNHFYLQQQVVIWNQPEGTSLNDIFQCSLKNWGNSGNLYTNGLQPF